MSLARDLPEILRRWLNGRQAEVFTALPARVKTYDAATQTADLEIVVRAPLVLDEDEEDVTHEPLPVIPNVRILFPAATGVFITFPIATGDEVLFVVSSLALGEYRRTGAPADAVDVRRNDLGCGGWAIPCVLKDSALLASATEDALVLEHPTKLMIGANATEKISRADRTDARLDAIEDFLSTHTHGGVQAGSGNTAAPMGAPSGSSTAADKGYVE